MKLCSKCKLPKDGTNRSWCKKCFAQYVKDRNHRLGVNKTFAPIYESLEHRFWSKVKRGTLEECWEFLASRDKAGYGTFGIGRGKSFRAHRVCWEITNGKIPLGKHVLHKCDNPSCCNPEHLFLGTNSDNVRDKVLKNRQTSKLTPEMVREIRMLSNDGERSFVIAQRFQISPQTVCDILKGRRWKHLKKP